MAKQDSHGQILCLYCRQVEEETELESLNPIDIIMILRDFNMKEDLICSSPKEFRLKQK